MAAPSRARDSRTPGVWPRRRHGCFFREASLGKTLLRPHVHPIARRRTEPPGKSEFPECDCDCECLWSQSHNPGSRIAQHMIAATESAAATVAQTAAADAAGAGAAEAEATSAAAPEADAAAAAAAAAAATTAAAATEAAAAAAEVEETM